MKFSRVLNDPRTKEAKQIVKQAEEALTETFTELAAVKSAFGSGIGGDPILLQLVVPYPHYCDLAYLEWRKFEQAEIEISKKLELGFKPDKEDSKILEEIQIFKAKYPNLLQTAATNGKVFFWNPGFLLSQSKLGRRLLVGHEGLHAALMHPNRRGHRIPALWNISVDFKVNHLLICDLGARRADRGQRLFSNPAEIFRSHLGNFITLTEYASFLKDPLHPPEKLYYHSPIGSLKRMTNPGYLKTSEPDPVLYFAEPNLPPHLKQPEAIYDYLLKQIPKCEGCGKLFHYPKTEEYKELSKKLIQIQETNVSANSEAFTRNH